MLLTTVQKIMLYSLGQFYHSLNQPLTEKPVRLQTPKIVFIEHLLQSRMLPKQERALYKNLETLEQKKLIEYHNKMIKVTEKGIQELEKIKKEFQSYLEIKEYFRSAGKPKRKLQTVISS